MKFSRSLSSSGQAEWPISLYVLKSTSQLQLLRACMVFWPHAYWTTASSSPCPINTFVFALKFSFGISFRNFSPIRRYELSPKTPPSFWGNDKPPSRASDPPWEKPPITILLEGMSLAVWERRVWIDVTDLRIPTTSWAESMSAKVVCLGRTTLVSGAEN